MHLLDEAMTTNRKKIKIEQLLLLLLRCCIPLFLALCMARPVITGMKNLIRDSKSSMVVLLDNSYSMESGDSRSNFSKASEETAKVIDNLPRGSQVALVGLAAPLAADEASGYDLASSRRLIREAGGGFSEGQTAERPRRSSDAVLLRHAPRRPPTADRQRFPEIQLGQ